MNINVQIPALYYASLLAQSKRKAQALLTYCTTIATGYKPSSRNFADLIGLSKSQAALWIIDFDQALFEENRTVAGHSKSPISGTFEPQNNYISKDKSDSCRANSYPIGCSKGANSEVSSNSVDTLTHTCAYAIERPLTGISSSKGEISLWKKFPKARKATIEQIKAKQEFQKRFRERYQPIRDKIEIKMSDKEIITLKARRKGSLLKMAINDKLASKEKALEIWNKIFELKDHIGQLFNYAERYDYTSKLCFNMITRDFVMIKVQAA